MIRKARVEKVFIVNDGAIPVISTGTTGLLYNDTTGALQLPAGNLAIYEGGSQENPRVLDASATGSGTSVVDNRVISLIQTRNTAGDRLPLPFRQFDEALGLSPDCIQMVRYAAKAQAPRRASATLIGAADGTIGAIPIYDELQYQVQISYNSRRHDWVNGLTTPTTFAEFFTPEYFNLFSGAGATIQSRDHLVQNMVYNILKRSAVWPTANADDAIIALALDSQAATTGALYTYATVAATAALPVGTSVQIAVTNAGLPVFMTLTEDIKEALNAAIAAVPAVGTAQLVAIDLSLAGTASGGTFGSECDQILLVSLNPALVTYDEIEAEVVNINVGVDGGFGSTTANTKLVYPSEGNGYSREIKLLFEAGNSQRMYTGDRNWQANSVLYPSGVIDGAKYDMFIIDYCDNRVASSGMPSYSPKRAYICFEKPVGTNARKTYFQDTIRAWFGAFLPGVNLGTAI